MKGFVIVASLLMLAGCAAQSQRQLTLTQLESSRYEVTERRHLPIDFAGIQQNLFRHAKLCGVTYTFEMQPNTTSFGHVVYRPTPDAGWDRSVVLALVLLESRKTNVKAYSYYSGAMDRVHRMLTAMMKPESCGPDASWENKLDVDG